MNFEGVGADPEATTGRQFRGFGDLDEPQDVDPEGPGRPLAAGRNGELHVMKRKGKGSGVIGSIAKRRFTGHATDPTP